MANLARLQREVQAARERFIRQLAAQSAPELRRLQTAYNGIKPEIAAILNSLESMKFPTGDEIRLAQQLRPYLNRIERELQAMQPIVINTASTLETGGLRIGYQTGLANLQVSGISTRFNQLDLNALRGAIGYVDSPAFAEAIGNYAGYHTDKVGDLILSAVANGRNPRETAQLARGYFETSQNPLADALRMTRTTQLYAGRVGTVGAYERYGVQEWVWICALDIRTCGGCWAMHGTRHPVRSKLNDHHNGRCAPGPITPTWESLGLKGNDTSVLNGETLFNNLPESDQRQILGRDYYSAYKDGRYKFSDLTATYTNPIFGEMRRKATLAELLQGS